MTFYTHAISSSILSLILSRTPSGNTGLEIATVFISGFLDIDHLHWVLKNRKKINEHGFYTFLHEARSILHEPFGALMIGVVIGAIYLVVGNEWLWVCYLSYLIHVFEDLFFGKSFLARPFTKRIFSWFDLEKKKIKKVEIVILLISVSLWYLYLKGYFG